MPPPIIIIVCHTFVLLLLGDETTFPFPNSSCFATDRASISEFRVATSPNPAGELSVFVSYRSDCNFSSRLSESIPHTTMQSMGSSDDLPSSHSPHTPVLGDLASSPPSTVVIDDYDPSKRRTSRNVTLVSQKS